MGEEKPNIFEQLVQALGIVAEELQNANSYLYGIGAVLTDMDDKLGQLNAKLDKLAEEAAALSGGIKEQAATVAAQLPQPRKTPEPPMTFEPKKRGEA